MTIVVRAVYENGVFRPCDPLPELGDRSSVILTIRKPLDVEGLRALRGTLSTEEANEMNRAIQEGRRVEGAW
jgi:predicted DNA-binding antitoxin AbrB/MazE fold protein